jgi:hypothetical protein
LHGGSAPNIFCALAKQHVGGAISRNSHDFALTALLPKPSRNRLDPAEDFLRLGGGNPWRVVPGLAFASVPGPRGFLARKTSTANRRARLFSKILLAPAACQSKCVADRGLQLFVDVKVVPGGLVSSRAFWLALERIAGEKRPGTQCSHRVHRRLLVDRSGRRRAFLGGARFRKPSPWTACLCVLRPRGQSEYLGGVLRTLFLD